MIHEFEKVADRVAEALSHIYKMYGIKTNIEKEKELIKKAGNLRPVRIAIKALKAKKKKEEADKIVGIPLD